MANKKAVLGRPTPDASLPRNAFDRESMREFHYALGQLVPAWWEPFTAGSHVKLNRKIFQRTSQLNTAAFPILDTHVQYYFVPYRLLWSLWDDFRLGIQDINSTGLLPLAAQSSTGRVSMPTRVPYTTIQDILTTLSNMASGSKTDIFGYPAEHGASKLLNLLGYGMPNSMSPTAIGDVNLWPILAYHKIYYDHFRNTQYESNMALAYNMDYLSTFGQSSPMKVPQADLERSYNGLLTLHYVNYRNDYFNNMYPSLNYISSSALQGSTGAPGVDYRTAIGLPPNIGVQSGNPVGSFGLNSGSGGTGVYLATVTDSNNYTSISLNSIRASFAIDKLLRSSAYAGQHVKDQYEARYGIKYNVNPSESVYIGSFKNDIQIGEVTSTSDTISSSGGAGLGAIGGKGVSFSDWGNTLEFTCKEDGIIMAMCYSTIRSNYRSLGIDSYLVKHLPEDYFVPEFQNLGLEPVYGQELNYSLGQSTILGYRPRNQRYKLGIDKSYGLFADVTQDLSMFINHTDVSRLPAVGQNGVNYGWFKMKPSDLDGITVSSYDGTWSTDQFFGQVVFGCTSIQNMSVHGQPSL